MGGADLSSRAEDGAVGGTLLCPLSGDGDNSRDGWGSAPDEGAEVVGVDKVSSLTTKSTDCWL